MDLAISRCLEKFAESLRTTYFSDITPVLRALLCVVVASGVSSAQGTNAVFGLKAVEEEFAFFDAEAEAVRNMPRPPVEAPLFFLLSKEVYPAEDRHLDVVAWLDTRKTGGQPVGELRVERLDAAGRVVMAETLRSLPGRQLFFSAPFGNGQEEGPGRLRLVWRNGLEVLGTAERAFEIAKPTGVATRGTVPIRIPNPQGVVLSRVPVSVGVPFPRGALASDAELALLDAEGREVPIQTRVTARWSRFGPVKWVLLDFEADLDGKPTLWKLEYGKGVRRREVAAMPVTPQGTGFPLVGGEGLKVDARGLSVRVGDRLEPWLAPEALQGGFVEHEDGRVFLMGSAGGKLQVEENGPVKTVVRARGDYTHPESGAPFCQYDTRYYFYRESRLMRIMHTWIFTGDGNRDRIRDMGWRFTYARQPDSAAFLLPEGEGTAWREGDGLLQVEHDRFELLRGEAVAGGGKRAPGVMRAVFGKMQGGFGTKDFWQNYPSELTLEKTAMTFHNWPRNGRASNVPITPANAFLLKFAHSGELLDFRLPEAYLHGEIPRRSSQGKGGERHWSSDPESINAQGIARTEEIWLMASEREGEVERVMQALNAEELRAVVDPAWLAASGAFYEIHQRNTERYPGHEAVYERIALAPGRWTERIGAYGKWIYGDALFEPRLAERSAGLYRTFRKAHQGWPYSWVPYVRSGDSRLFKLADNATRQMIDSNFCHYVSPEVKQAVEGAEGKYYRREGWWFRSMIPWAGWRGPVSRSYLADCDYLWHAYYVTGYRRPVDIALFWGQLVKEEPNLAPPESRSGPIQRGSELRRMSFTMLKSCTEMYQATFDPWFLVAMHALAEMHLTENRPVQWEAQGGERVGHFWEPGDREYHRFTGRREFEPYLANAARLWATYRGGPWSPFNPPLIEQTAYAFGLTGDETFARRAAYYLDYAQTSHWSNEEHPYLVGIIANDLQLSRSSVFTGFYLSQFPLALAMFEKMGREPEPLAEAFYQMGDLQEAPEVGDGIHRYDYPTIRVQKKAGEPLDLLLELRRAEGEVEYRIAGPSDQPVLSGRRSASMPERVEIPAEAPEGVYTVQVTGWLPLKPEEVDFSLRRFPGLKIPLSPAGTPEVMEVVPEQGVGRAMQRSQYWFRVPEGVKTFTVEFDILLPNTQARRVSIWGPDGELAWDWQKVVAGVRHPITIRAEVAVKPAQQGRLWRVTLPGGSTGFRFSREIPGAVSVDRERWFHPGGPQ